MPIRSGLTLWVAILAASAVAGCAAIRDITGFGDQLARAQSKVRIAGTVETEGEAEGTLVVLLARSIEEGDTAIVGVDTYVRRNPGTFLFVVAPGRYQLGAYEDRNGNGLLDPDEPTVRVTESPVYDLAPGANAQADLLLKEDSALGDEIAGPIDVLSLVERSDTEQREFSPVVEAEWTAEMESQPDWSTIREEVMAQRRDAKYPRQRGREVSLEHRRELDPVVDQEMEDRLRVWRSETVPAATEERRKNLEAVDLLKWVALTLRVNDRDLQWRVRVASTVKFP